MRSVPAIRVAVLLCRTFLLYLHGLALEEGEVVEPSSLHVTIMGLAWQEACDR
jgi:hypothetical protein